MNEEEKEQALEEWNNLEQGSYETEQRLKMEKKEFELEKEIEERDKIINMMAEYIFYNQDFKFQGYHSIQDVKEYFAYKAYITYITKKEERNDHRRSEFKSSGKTKKRE